MNILLITAYFPPDTGSAANLFFELGGELVRKGHLVTVLTSFPSYHVTGEITHYKGKKFSEEQINGIKIFRVKVPQFPRYIPATRALWQFTMAYCFSNSIKKLKEHDIALIYSPPLPLGFTGAFLKKKIGTPFILNVQDLFPQSAIDLKILKNRLLICFFQYLERNIYNFVDHITVHSPGNRNRVVKTGIDPKKVTIVPNWIDTNFVNAGEKPNPFSKEHGLLNKFVVSFAGVIGYSQDIDIVLNAAHLLREEKDILFLIVGDGVEKGRLMKKAQDMGLDNVTFLPMQPRSIYPFVLHTSDVCLVTLNKEVLSPVVPSKILSIMAAEKPLIACMNLEGDAPKVIKDAKCGFVFPAGEHKGLAQAALKLYNSSKLREEYGLNGRTYCVKNFSLDTCADRYIRLFEQVLN